MEISSKYQPKDVEHKWYNFWINNKIHHAEIDNSKKPFTIVIPPPNITGALHMGHALNNTLQDIFIRFHKKIGFNTCWIPGTDHGGIATQNVITKQLIKDGFDVNKMPREELLDKMWKWREETGDRILMQLRKLGCLCDWERTRFTMDSVCADAVFESFKRLFDEGLIYRGNYMVNWCPKCNTALSDIEVEHIEQNGSLWHIKYPFKDNPNEFIVVATTRPETMLGDSAVAVNPNDDRYKNFIGKSLILPLVNREIKIIADEMVDKEFGTGCVKITPSHDPNDYETAHRHNLEFIAVIDKFGKMTENSGKYAKLDRYEARKQIIKDLEDLGLLEKTEKYKNKISVCYRCESVIEPLVSEQWYLNTKDMANSAINASKNGQVKFLPENWEKPYLAWMENLHDWCISRQIWWGHRIPVWYCESCGKAIVSKEIPNKCEACENTEKFRQDSDVLDTWFSSALWPFSTLGWPNDNSELKYFYPTSVLATGHEILYLWVARMMMMGLKFMDDVPFKNVYIHGIVRDSKGKKMSKSLGNVIDPLDIIEQFGTDALRLTLTANGIMGRDLQIADESFLMSRNFCNKLWNASRLILTNLQQEKNLQILRPDQNDNKKNLELADKWILSILQKTKIQVKKHYENSDFAMVAREMYEFIWNKYCDWYLEIIKNRLYSDNQKDKETAYSVLIAVLSEILNIINPIMPFITEEINENISKITNIPYQNLATAGFPEYNQKLVDETSETQMQKIIDIVLAIRNIRGEMQITPAKEIEVFIKLKSCELNNTEIGYIQKLTRANRINQGLDISKPKNSIVNITEEAEIYIPLAGLIDFEKEKQRLNKELVNLEKELKILKNKLANESFITKAPETEVLKIKEKYNIAIEKIDKIIKNLKELD